MKDLEHEASGNVFPGDLRERVSRQMILRELGEKGQAAISSAHFLVIGAGGLGSPAILYLAAAGAGTITVVDADTVSVSNLSRQILHTTSTVNVNKAKSAVIAVERLNPHCRARIRGRREAQGPREECGRDPRLHGQPRNPHRGLEGRA